MYKSAKRHSIGLTWPRINVQSLKILKKVYYLCDKIGDRGRSWFDSVITRIMSGWNKSRDLVSLLAHRALLLGEKDRLYSTCSCGVTLYENETWPVEKEGVIRIEKNDTRMFRWMCNGRLEDRISKQELMTSLKLKKMREWLQVRRLQWFGNLERINESAWSGKWWTFKISGRFPWHPGKTWNEVISSDLQ